MSQPFTICHFKVSKCRFSRKFQCQLQNNFSKAISQVNEEQLNKFNRELDRLQILLINKSPNFPDYGKLANEIAHIQYVT
ncbi:hypothetical protein QUW22_06155 [Ligilactobacillus salivarius]|uniref:hypothetical protein n=1 Tax=Ligilactobacillus salivarius TaxID=1624 RepID=UPI0025A39153|nr:hypothetical protein [Ligilactobacillus salivarius]MDM8223766.1 hypothetical protein [Ligilactobacillus salivarius]